MSRDADKRVFTGVLGCICGCEKASLDLGHSFWDVRSSIKDCAMLSINFDSYIPSGSVASVVQGVGGS